MIAITASRCPDQPPVIVATPSPKSGQGGFIAWVGTYDEHQSKTKPSPIIARESAETATKDGDRLVHLYERHHRRHDVYELSQRHRHRSIVSIPAGNERGG